MPKVRASCARRRSVGLRQAATIGLTLTAAACEQTTQSPGWRERADSAGFRAVAWVASACADCIDLTPVVTLGDEMGDGFLEDRGTLDYVVRDREGRYWVGQRGNIKVYAPDGKLLRVVGTRGQGPMEFEFAQPVRVDASGMVHILDVRLGRETIVRPDFTRQSDRRIPVGFDAIAALPGEGDRYVISKWVPTPDRVGYPLHVVSGEEIVHSFGLVPGADSSTISPAESARLISATTDGYVLSAARNQYVVEVWRSDGARIAGYELPGLNPTTARPGVWTWDNPPPNHLGDIAPYDDRFLVIVTRHRRPEWKELVVERVSRGGIPHLGSIDGNVATLYRSRVDVLDLNTASVVASSWYDGFLMRFIERDVVLRLMHNTEGEPLLQVLRLTYRADG